MNVACKIGAMILLIVHSNLYGADWIISGVEQGNPDCDYEMPLSMYISYSNVSAGKSKCYLQLSIEGNFDADDVGRLNALRELYKNNKTNDSISFIRLDSLGGSVASALEIANEIRRAGSPLYGVATSVGESGQCMSSCVIVYLAGFRRHAFGSIGVHRPRFLPSDVVAMGYEDLSAAYASVYNALSAAFRDWNVHPSFIDKMWSVHSSEIKILTSEEMIFYRIFGVDSVYEEQISARLIDVCGEGGPALERHYLQSIDVFCGERFIEFHGRQDANACIEEIFNEHPYKDCYMKLYGN